MELRQPLRRRLILRPKAILHALALGVLLALLSSTAALAAPELRQPDSQTKPPPGFKLTAREAIRIAASSETIREARDGRRLRPVAYTRGPGRWQVSWFAGGREVAQARIDDRFTTVLEAWTGHQVAWSMARGYEGAFGRKLNAPYVWIPLCVLFLLPFVDPRRPFRLLHLDLAVLLAFGVSHFFFNRGEIGVSVPLVYPVLAYLLCRLLWLGVRRTRRPPRAGPPRLVPVIPIAWLSLAIIWLLAFRVGLNIVDSNVIDVGYAGVIGADRIADGDGLYGDGFADDVEHGDTYGPFTYLTYLPFEQLMPWKGSWDGLPSAHAAAIAYDVLTLLGLLLLGRRLRAGPAGRELGVALGYAWVTYPYAIFALQTNSNDALVGMLTVFAMLGLTLAPARSGLSALARGAAIGLAAAAKFAPLALAPLMATAAPLSPRRGRIAAAGVFAVALAAVLIATVAPFVPDGGLRELYDRTLGYQAGRRSPFSVWGQLDAGETYRAIATGFALTLAIAVAFVPRRKTPLQVAALGAAVLIAVQLAASHWFYLYVAWFAPLALVALLAAAQGGRPALSIGSDPRPRTADEPAAAD